MAQAELTKLNEYAHIGQSAGSAAVSKLVMYARLVPGDGGDSVPVRQGHVHTQIVRSL